MGDSFTPEIKEYLIATPGLAVFLMYRLFVIQKGLSKMLSPVLITFI